MGATVRAARHQLIVGSGENSETVAGPSLCSLKDETPLGWKEEQGFES